MIAPTNAPTSAAAFSVGVPAAAGVRPATPLRKPAGRIASAATASSKMVSTASDKSSASNCCKLVCTLAAEPFSTSRVTAVIEAAFFVCRLTAPISNAPTVIGWPSPKKPPIARSDATVP